MYETKDSGQRATFDSGMVRDLQEGKPRFDLIMPKDLPYSEQMLTRWAALMERGRAKYGERNWEKANGEEELDRAKASALRHLMQWMNGEEDEDHAAAVMFNITEAEYVKHRMKQEDRPAIVSDDDGHGHSKKDCPEAIQYGPDPRCLSLTAKGERCEYFAGHSGDHVSRTGRGNGIVRFSRGFTGHDFGDVG